MEFIILDNDEIVKDTIFTYLEAKGHSCERTSKEEEVSTLINKKNIDVVVADSSMLNSNGAGLLKMIQEKKLQTKVILINGITNKKNHGNAVVPEAYNLYRKPFNSGKLVNFFEEVKKSIGEID